MTEEIIHFKRSDKISMKASQPHNQDFKRGCGSQHLRTTFMIDFRAPITSELTPRGRILVQSRNDHALIPCIEMRRHILELPISHLHNPSQSSPSSLVSISHLTFHRHILGSHQRRPTGRGKVPLQGTNLTNRLRNKGRDFVTADADDLDA